MQIAPAFSSPKPQPTRALDRSTAALPRGQRGTLPVLAEPRFAGTRAARKKTVQQKPVKLFDKLQGVILSMTLGITGVLGGVAANGVLNTDQPLPALESFQPAQTPADLAEFQWQVPSTTGKYMKVKPEQLSADRQAHFREVEQVILDELGRMLDGRPDLQQYVQADRIRISLFEGNSYKRDDGMTLGGEASERGWLSFATNRVLQIAQVRKDGKNLVAHEFTHYFDFIDGGDGRLPGMSDEQYRMLRAEIDAEVRKILMGDSSPLDVYAAMYQKSDGQFYYHGAGAAPIESLAVAVETFFEKPIDLRIVNHVLYERMRNFFRYDPIREEPYTPEPGETTTLIRNHPDTKVDELLTLATGGGSLLTLMLGLTLFAARRDELKQRLAQRQYQQ